MSQEEEKRLQHGKGEDGPRILVVCYKRDLVLETAS